MKRFILLCALSVSVACAAKSNLDIQMDYISPYLSSVEMRDEAQRKRLRVVVKALMKLNYVDMAIIYNYLEMKVKNSYLLAGE